MLGELLAGLAGFGLGTALDVRKDADFRKVPGLVIVPEMSNEEFIIWAYRRIHGRDPEPEGLAFWLNAMNQGVTKPEFILWAIDSDEFKQRVGSLN